MGKRQYLVYYDLRLKNTDAFKPDETYLKPESLSFDSESSDPENIAEELSNSRKFLESLLPAIEVARVKVTVSKGRNFECIPLPIIHEVKRLFIQKIKEKKIIALAL